MTIDEMRSVVYEKYRCLKGGIPVAFAPEDQIVAVYLRIIGEKPKPPKTVISPSYKYGKDEIDRLLGTDTVVAYPFGSEIQYWNLKEFDPVTKKHKRIPLIYEVFSTNCYWTRETRSTHG